MAPRPSIILDFIARNASLLRAARENEQSLRRQRRALRSAARSGGAAAAAYSSLAVAAGAAAVATGLLVRNSLRAARDFDTFAATTGVSIEHLQQLEAVGARVGLVFDDVSDVIQTFTESVGDARTQILQGERGTQVNALRLLGFSVEDILAAERDITSFFDQFFERLRSRSAAEAQFILGEFSLPDAARQLLALPDSPLRVLIDIPQLTSAENQRLVNLENQYTQARLRFTRDLSRFVAQNADSIQSFIDAFIRNTPIILEAGRTLGNALVTVSDIALRAFSQLQDLSNQSGFRISSTEVLAGGGLAFLFRQQIGNLLRSVFGFLARFAGTALVRIIGTVLAGVAATAVSPVAFTAAIVAGVAAVTDEVVFGARGRRAIIDGITSLFDWVTEQILGARDEAVELPDFQQQGPALADVFEPQGPPAPPQVEDNTEAISALDAILEERLRQINDEITQLEHNQLVATAQGDRAQTIRTLERLRDLLTLREVTREQQRELDNIRDPEFVVEAHEQFVIGLRRQVAELEQQIASAGDPEARRLQEQVQELQRRLSSLQEVPFNVAQFQSDRIIALRRQVAEAEALLNLQADPQYIEAQQRLRAIEIQNEGISLDTQLRDFSRFAAINRANETKRLQLAVLQAEDAANAVQARRALLLRQRQAEQALNNAQLRQQIDTFDDTAEGRRQERQLRDQLNLMRRAEDAQFRINNLSREYFETSIDALGQLLMGVTSLSDVIRSLVRNLLNRTVGANLELLSSQILSLGTNAGTSAGALDNSAGGPNLGAPKVVAAVEQQGQRQQMSQGQILAAGKMVVAAVNQQTRQQRVSQSLTLAAGKMVVAAVEQQNRLSQNGDLASARVIAAALQQRQQDIRFSQGEPLSIDMPATGDTYLEINVDARGGDEQSIQRGIDRATPELIRRVNESQIAGNATSPIQRDRIRRNIRVK